mgnify:CR=1 FL=1
MSAQPEKLVVKESGTYTLVDGRQIQVIVNSRRHSKWGTGYYNAKKIKKLGPGHKLVLRVLEENGAFEASGMTSRNIWFKGEKILKDEGDGRYWTLTGVRARLSEMQRKDTPINFVGSGPNQMKLKDEDEQKFRMEKGNRWFLLRREGMGLLR